MKKFVFIYLLVSFFLGMSLSAQTDDVLSRGVYWESGRERIRIISYNILNGFEWGKDKGRQERFVQWMGKQNPEIVAMQELCGFTQEKLSEMAKRWGHPYAVILKEDGYPVGITSKKPITVKGKCLKNCGHGMLHVETYGQNILVTHLNPEDTGRRRDEADFIVKYIKDNSLDRCLLMGDMNSHSPFDASYMEANATDLLRKNYGGKDNKNLLDGWFDYSVISRLLSVPLIDAVQRFVVDGKRVTYPSPILIDQSQHEEVRKRVGERLDYIFVTPSVAQDIVDGFVYNGSETDYLSDHYPIAIEMVIPCCPHPL